MLRDRRPGPPLDPMLRDWLRPEVGEVSLVRELVGGLSARMLHLRRADGRGDVVVRRWPGDAEHDPAAVRREAAGLEALAGTGLPIPRLIAADPDGTASGRPCTVTTFLDGAPDLAPADLRRWVQHLAAMLARIHAVPSPSLDPLPLWGPDETPWLDRGGDPGLARAAHDLAARPTDPDRRVLGHGDYQHFNVLWQGGRISAVVDWPNVGLADRGVDVGHCRLNLAVLHSAEAAMWFLEDYEESAGTAVDPACDIQRLLCFGEDWPEFIPLQVAGRAPVDGPGMAGRVRETIERTLARL
ncbi:phosphotransferase family protein [Brachybacterium sp. YJGR34]|uniref:phosphotransferase family protein n=1 Tax=Brachybacterium sp. YJGR34 TaxID=2059911 RepID=UPI00130098EC|nr:phosphotransferase [Brachybacterium sp. YJGR34]